MSDLLARQLRRCGLDPAQRPDDDGWQAFLERVGEAYAQAEQDRYLLERSLTISSAEMQQLHRELRAQSEAERAEQQLRLRSVINAIGDGLCFTDEDGTINFMNPVGLKLLGLRAEQAEGMNVVRAILGPAGRMNLPDAECLRSESETFLRRDGTTFPVSFVLTPIPGPSGPAGYVLVFRDITRQQEAAMRLREAIDEAQAANRAKSAFLANMSHEIRTPLTGILGFTELLCRGAAHNADEQHEWLQLVQSNAEHLLSLINDILDLSKIEAGCMDVRREDISPCHLVSEVASLMRPRARSHGLDLEVEYASEIPALVRSDATRVRQVLLNLVGNAIKFTDDGNITIRVRHEHDGSRLCVEVIDSGTGMSEDDLERIFEPFVQVDGTMTRQHGGSGLGLAICRRIIDSLGGTITVASTPGAGSQFTVEIPAPVVEPLTPPNEGASEPLLGASRAAEADPPLSGRVLVVDDGETNRKLISLMLSRAGATVDTAPDGARALEVIRTNPYDLVIMDVQMPIMDGFEATRRLRATGFRAPILALTAHAMDRDRRRCLAAGCTGYLTKPVDRRQLLARVAQIMPGTTRRTAEARDVPAAPPSIRSRLPQDDPEFQSIIADFVDTMQGKLGKLEDAMDAGDLTEVARLAHWLKGTGGTAGFPQLTRPADAVQLLATDEAPIAQLRKHVTELIELARRIRR